jgi:hypothetical protein
MISAKALMRVHCARQAICLMPSGDFRKGKPMTLIAGFSGFGGLVLFSDKQETVQGYAKKQVDKIDFWTPGKDGPELLMGEQAALFISKNSINGLVRL